jgi:hypothetical protein
MVADGVRLRGRAPRADALTQDERRLERAQDERAHADDPRRLFVADATLEQSRNPVAQLARAARSAARSQGLPVPRIVQRDGVDDPTRSLPGRWWTRPDRASASLPELQHAQTVRRTLHPAFTLCSRGGRRASCRRTSGAP